MLFLQQKEFFMHQNDHSLSSCPLFTHMADLDIHNLFHCFQIQEKVFQKNEYIIQAGMPITDIILIEEGLAHIVEDDYWGNRTLIDCINQHNVFGIGYAYSPFSVYPVSLVAKKKTKVIFINATKVFTPCGNHCIHHQQLIQNAVSILAHKNVRLIDKITHLSRRSTKDKILSFLSFYSKKVASPDFYIPFDRQELADYLSVDRSALSKELGKLKQEGIIDFEKNHFILKYEH